MNHKIKNRIRWLQRIMKTRYWRNWDELVGNVAGIDTENRLKHDEGFENSHADGGGKSKIKGRCEKVERRLQTRKTAG